ncbi:MAG: tyrosine-type recombinase/integrase [Clostridia bacterium]|nr:tyrosine-type recombinase/integrase [Clostridia bacterium]
MSKNKNGPSTFNGLRDYTVCTLMVDSGLRLHEIVTLERKHVHLDERYLIVTGKGDKQRIVPFGDFTARTLRAYDDARKSWCPPIASFFVTVDGEPMIDTTLKDVFRRLKERSGIPRLHPHLLRHTFATKYLGNGGDVYTLQRILGHTTLDMVKKYLHLSNQLTISAYCSPIDVLRQKSQP